MKQVIEIMWVDRDNVSCQQKLIHGKIYDYDVSKRVYF